MENSTQFSSCSVVWHANQPQNEAIPVPFPENDVEGNDDSHGQDEHSNPYEEYDNSDELLPLIPNHGIGELSRCDMPSFSVTGNWLQFLSFDDKYEEGALFREFARVELWDGERAGGKFWFRISEHKEWHHHMKAATLSDNGSAVFVIKWHNDGSSAD